VPSWELGESWKLEVEGREHWARSKRAGT
jgi:hypothetical protein